MSNLQQFFGPPATTSIVGYNEATSQGNFTESNYTTAYRAANNIGIYPTGALTASTYKTIITVSGQGGLRFLALQNGGTTTRTFTVRLTIDSVVVATRVITSTDVVGRTLIVVGAQDNSGSLGQTALSFDNIRFNVSMLVEVQCNSTTGASNVADVLASYVLT